MNRQKIFRKFLVWRLKHMSNRQFMMILSVIIGIASGIGAVVIKNLVHMISAFVKDTLSSGFDLFYLIAPTIGITLAVLFIKYIVKRPVRHGVPNVLYAISKAQGHMNSHNMFSSIVTSALTVGFGGSVGLEGPTVSTGAAIGSNVGRLFHLNYRCRCFLSFRCCLHRLRRLLHLIFSWGRTIFITSGLKQHLIL